ncbi:MAG: alkaline phosphatase family protein [Proteobacteria bacterium]|nr:alkaline phosphatase family protein [Pseudomonadota bacterium]
MTKRRINRRTALKGLVAAGATPLLPGCEPTGGEDELPTEVTRELLRERIDTVVFLMMENRSFDHFLGAMSLEEGNTDVDGLTEEMSNPNLAGESVLVHPADGACIDDPPHSWGSSHDQFNEGANDGFVRENEQRHPSSGHQAMGYWGRDGLPATYAIADAGVVCDRWYCSLMAQTWPNRFYYLAGQNGGGFGNEQPEEDFAHIFERLDEAGVGWANYFGNLPFGFLLRDLTLAREEYIPLEDFFHNAEVGLLPAVTYIDPIFGRNDDHPPAHPMAGQVLIASVYEALANSPHWDRCLLVITYDEHGGFFDHVPPPLAQDDRPESGHDQLGFRVPTVIAGPWVKQGAVSHSVYDHTSCLALLEYLHELEPLTARDAAANNLLDVLDEERLLTNTPAAPATLPVIDADPEVIYADECLTGLRDAIPEGLTGQPELEAAFDALPEPSLLDRRADTDAIYEACLEEAVRLGVLRRI